MLLLKEEDEGRGRTSVPTQLMKLKRTQWWILVFISIFFLISAQAIGVLLGRFYYNEGGNSKWISTLVQTCGFPILYLPLCLFSASKSSSSFSSSSSCSFTTLFSFEKILKSEIFAIVLEMQIYTSLVASCVAVIGLFASGEWLLLSEEMEEFQEGQVIYVLTLVGTAVSCQLGSVGSVALIFLVSSLFSNFIGTLSLIVTPLAAIAVFHDKLTEVKIVAMLIAFTGFAFYIYQNYLDDLKVQIAREAQAE
ncbi:unnamed protein product [Arabidopsis halleri]